MIASCVRVKYRSALIGFWRWFPLIDMVRCREIIVRLILTGDTLRRFRFNIGKYERSEAAGRGRLCALIP
jgi:hypothetical protein